MDMNMRDKSAAALFRQQGLHGCAALVEALAAEEERTGQRMMSMSVPLGQSGGSTEDERGPVSTSFGSKECGVLEVLSMMVNGKGLPSTDPRVLEKFDVGCLVVANVTKRAATTPPKKIFVSDPSKSFKDVVAAV